MANLETTYLGLKLKNPIIVSSSGLTNSADKIKKLEQAGAGAVVMKSLFEEQINHEAGRMIDESEYPEAEEYIYNYVKENSVSEYLKTIKEAKAAVKIPVIASINCASAKDWTGFAKEIQEAGADALELNMHIIPVTKSRGPVEFEQLYFDIVEKVKSLISIPVAVKISYHFSNILNFVHQLEARKVEGVVLFNRFYEPDINIDTLKFSTSKIFSTPDDIRHSLRWIGILNSFKNRIEVSATTGIHSAEGVIKMLLAGAETTQICSILYKNDINEIGVILDELTKWMDEKSFEKIGDFRGLLSYKSTKHPAVYERAQFMKYFSKVE